MSDIFEMFAQKFVVTFTENRCEFPDEMKLPFQYLKSIKNADNPCHILVQTHHNEKFCNRVLHLESSSIVAMAVITSAITIR